MVKPIHAVGVIFQDESGRILALKRHTAKPQGGQWGLPGGKVDTGETPSDAAAREAEEETSHMVDPQQLQLIKTYREHWSESDVLFNVFRLHVQSGDIDVNLDTTAHTQHVWAEPRELLEYPDLMEGFAQVLKEVYVDF